MILIFLSSPDRSVTSFARWGGALSTVTAIFPKYRYMNYLRYSTNAAALRRSYALKNCLPLVVSELYAVTAFVTYNVRN